jgi:hypothetical protein
MPLPDRFSGFHAIKNEKYYDRLVFKLIQILAEKCCAPTTSAAADDDDKVFQRKV